MGGANIAAAHPIPFSYVDLKVGRNAIDGTLVAHIFDIGHDLAVDPPDRLLDAAFLAQRANAVVALLSPRLVVSADGKPLAASWSGVEPVADRQSIRLQFRCALSAPAGTVTVSTVMFPYDPIHQTFLNIYEGEALTQAILDRGRPQFEYFAGTRQGAMAVIGTFSAIRRSSHSDRTGSSVVPVGLLLLGGSFRQLTLVVTAFTVAHSITLSLAALNILTPPARLIEPAIALSIVYVGADNLLIKDGRDVRAWIAFAFGFVHGFGFAERVARNGSAGPRAGLVVVLVQHRGRDRPACGGRDVVAAALAALRARNAAVGRQLATVGSVVVIAAGTFWFVQRVFFAGGML